MKLKLGYPKKTRVHAAGKPRYCLILLGLPSDVMARLRCTGTVHRRLNGKWRDRGGGYEIGQAA